MHYAPTSAERAAGFSEDHSIVTDTTARRKRLQTLKLKLLSNLPDQRHRDRAEWHEKTATVTELEESGEPLLKHLCHEFHAETKEAATDTPTTRQAAKRCVLEQFVDERTRIITRCGALLNELIAFVTSNPAAAYRRLAGHPHADNNNIVVLAHAAGISPLARHVDHVLSRSVD